MWSTPQRASQGYPRAYHHFLICSHNLGRPPLTHRSVLNRPGGGARGRHHCQRLTPEMICVAGLLGFLCIESEMTGGRLIAFHGMERLSDVIFCWDSTLLVLDVLFQQPSQCFLICAGEGYRLHIVGAEKDLRILSNCIPIPVSSMQARRRFLMLNRA